MDTDHLLVLMERAVDQRRLLIENLILKEEYASRYGFPQIVGEGPALEEVSLALQRAAPTDTTVLLLGESGTGKELFARALHHLSPRRDGPFLAINCAAIPEHLLENELFGHEKGAFTGAGWSQDRQAGNGQSGDGAARRNRRAAAVTSVEATSGSSRTFVRARRRYRHPQGGCADHLRH